MIWFNEMNSSFCRRFLRFWIFVNPQDSFSNGEQTLVMRRPRCVLGVGVSAYSFCFPSHFFKIFHMFLPDHVSSCRYLAAQLRRKWTHDQMGVKKFSPCAPNFLVLSAILELTFVTQFTSTFLH